MISWWKRAETKQPPKVPRPLVGPVRSDAIQPFLRNLSQNGIRNIDYQPTNQTEGGVDEADHDDDDIDIKEETEVSLPEFPYCYSKCCHAVILPLTFICPEKRWSTLNLNGTHDPICMKISAEDIQQVWGHLFATRDRSFHLVPLCVRTVCYSTIGCPIEMAYKLVTHIPTAQNQKASWTFATTVASGVHWVVPDGRLAAEQCCAQVSQITWEADPELLADEDFMRMKSFADDDMNIHSYLRDNETRAHLPGPNSITIRQDGVAWMLARMLDQWQDEHTIEEEDEEDAVSLPAAPVRDFVDSLRNKVHSQKNLMSLDQGITMELYPVHPGGWQPWLDRMNVAKTTKTLFDPHRLDPFISLSVTVELVAIPILAHPNRDTVQAEQRYTLGQVPRTNTMWKAGTGANWD